MDPINPWLDGSELRELAESLMPKKRHQQPRLDDAGFSEGFVGFAGSEPIPSATTEPALDKTTWLEQVDAAPKEPESTFASQPSFPPKPEPALASQPEPAIQASPVTPPARVLPRSSFEEQCLHFQQQMQQSYGADGLFILDHDGETVFGKDHHPHLHFIARSLTKNAGRRGLPKGHIHIKIGPGKTLEIIPINLPNGGWIVGTVMPQPLDMPSIRQWVQQLSKLSHIPERI